MSWSDPHRTAVLQVSERYARRQHLRTDLMLPFHIMSSERVRAAFYSRVQDWTGADLAAYEDDLSNPELMAQFNAQIERYRIDADPANIEVKQTDDDRRLEVRIAPPEPVATRIEQIGESPPVAF